MKFHIAMRPHISDNRLKNMNKFGNTMGCWMHRLDLLYGGQFGNMYAKVTNGHTI